MKYTFEAVSRLVAFPRVERWPKAQLLKIFSRVFWFGVKLVFAAVGTIFVMMKMDWGFNHSIFVVIFAIIMFKTYAVWSNAKGLIQSHQVYRACVAKIAQQMPDSESVTLEVFKIDQKVANSNKHQSFVPNTVGRAEFTFKSRTFVLVCDLESFRITIGGESINSKALMIDWPSWVKVTHDDDFVATVRYNHLDLKPWSKGFSPRQRSVNCWDAIMQSPKMTEFLSLLELLLQKSFGLVDHAQYVHVKRDNPIPLPPAPGHLQEQARVDAKPLFNRPSILHILLFADLILVPLIIFFGAYEFVKDDIKFAKGNGGCAPNAVFLKPDRCMPQVASVVNACPQNLTLNQTGACVPFTKRCNLPLVWVDKLNRCAVKDIVCPPGESWFVDAQVCRRNIVAKSNSYIGICFLFLVMIGVPVLPQRNTRRTAVQKGISLDGAILEFNAVKIDLSQPFRVFLFRDPSADVLGIEIRQLVDGSHDSLKFTVPATFGIHSRESLPVMSIKAQSVSNDAILNWVWPTITSYAQANGHEIGYDITRRVV